MISTQFQASEPSDSEGEDFLIHTYVFFVARTGTILDPGT